jgi:hypothetical protein
LINEDRPAKSMDKQASFDGRGASPNEKPPQRARPVIGVKVVANQELSTSLRTGATYGFKTTATVGASRRWEGFVAADRHPEKAMKGLKGDRTGLYDRQRHNPFGSLYRRYAGRVPRLAD